VRGSLDLQLQRCNPRLTLPYPQVSNAAPQLLAHEVMAALRNGNFMRVDDTNLFKGEQTAQACANA